MTGGVDSTPWMGYLMTLDPLNSPWLDATCWAKQGPPWHYHVLRRTYRSKVMFSIDQICSLIGATSAGDRGLTIGLRRLCRRHRAPSAKVCISNAVEINEGTSCTAIMSWRCVPWQGHPVGRKTLVCCWDPWPGARSQVTYTKRQRTWKVQACNKTCRVLIEHPINVGQELHEGFSKVRARLQWRSVGENKLKYQLCQNVFIGLKGVSTKDMIGRPLL